MKIIEKSAISELIKITQKGRIIRYAGFFLLVMAAQVMLGSFPAAVKAQDNSVDLELGGEGSVSWNIGNIIPGNSGNKVVTLHNTGLKNGVVTIWISDIIDSEGNNPESETGSTAEPGELGDHLLFNVTCPNLNTNLVMPTTIDGLPATYTSARYLKVNPLNAGVTVTLNWQWNLPTETGNDVQGDGLSFTINYRLDELPAEGLAAGPPLFPPPLGGEALPLGTTDVRGSVSNEGVFVESVTVTSQDGQCALNIPEGTVGLTEDLEPLSEISVLKMDDPPPPPEGANVFGLTYDFLPDGATFEPPITLVFHYDPDDIPAGVAEQDLVIAYYDDETGEWIILECVVNPETNTITATISHFTAFAVFGYSQMSQAAAFNVHSLIISPTEVNVGKDVTIDVSVTNIGATTGTYHLTLKINDTLIETRNLIISAHQSERVTFTLSAEAAGSYYVDINGVIGSFTAKPPTEPPSPQVEPSSPPPETVSPLPETVSPPSETPTIPEEPVETTVPTKRIGWPIFSSIIGGLVVVGLLCYFLIRREIHKKQ